MEIRVSLMYAVLNPRPLAKENPDFAALHPGYTYDILPPPFEA